RVFFCFMIQRQPISTLFPYTTLFRSILIAEILLMVAILTMNAADQLLQVRLPASYPDSGSLFFSSIAMPWLSDMSTSSLVATERDRKSTRLNSSHVKISYAVFCLKKK